MTDRRGTGSLPLVRFIHTSDIHIDGHAPSARGLHDVVETAISQEVDLVIIAGDLFDHARVGTDAIDQTREELARLGRPVVIIPGNHDSVGEYSIHRRVDLRTAGDHVFFVSSPQGEELVFEHLRLAVWARGIENHDPSFRPLEGYRCADSDFWRVVVTHGHLVSDWESSLRSSPITAAELGRLCCDYVALGHWHGFLDVSEGATPAYYSGSPWETGPLGASVNLVTLEPGSGARVERVMLRDPAS